MHRTCLLSGVERTFDWLKARAAAAGVCRFATQIGVVRWTLVQLAVAPPIPDNSAFGTSFDVATLLIELFGRLR